MGDKFEGNIKNSRSLARLLPFSFFTVFAADYVTKQIALEVVGGRCAGFIGIHHTDHPALVVEVNDFLRHTYFTVIFVRSAFIDQSAGLVVAERLTVAGQRAHGNCRGRARSLRVHVTARNSLPKRIIAVIVRVHSGQLDALGQLGKLAARPGRRVAVDRRVTENRPLLHVLFVYNPFICGVYFVISSKDIVQYSTLHFKYSTNIFSFFSECSIFITI